MPLNETEIFELLFRDITKKKIVNAINTIAKNAQDDVANEIYNFILNGNERGTTLNFIKKHWKVYKKPKTTSMKDIC